MLQIIRAIVPTSQVGREMLLLLNYFATVHDLNDVDNRGLASIGFSYMSIFVMQKMHLVPKFLDNKEIEAVEFSQELGQFSDISLRLLIVPLSWIQILLAYCMRSFITLATSLITRSMLFH